MENNTQNNAPAPTVPIANVAPAPTEAPQQPPKQSGNSIFKWLALILLAIFLIAGGVGLGMYMSNNQKKEEEKITPTITMNKPSPKVSQALPTSKPTEAEEVEEESMESEQEQAEAAIKAAFAEKFSKQVDEISITISDYEPSFAKGGVSFAGEMGGGWFLAAEVGGTWVIADDGNGTITCEKIEPYNFPVSMVSECWSEASQELIYR